MQLTPNGQWSPACLQMEHQLLIADVDLTDEKSYQDTPRKSSPEKVWPSAAANACSPGAACLVDILEMTKKHVHKHINLASNPPFPIGTSRLRGRLGKSVRNIISRGVKATGEGLGIAMLEHMCIY